jgi:GTP-binding protein
MSFVDKVRVHAKAGDGGNGKLSFRHEKFISKGGPDGGDGGKGGNIILMASRNQNTLATFRYQKEITATPGASGGSSNKHGRNGKDLIVAVPVGTVATNQAGEVVADLTQDEQKVIIAAGGSGGFGNAHFVSSRRQAPNFAEKGEPGDDFELTFELKLIADVGLVGLPNAGKSTLLSRISNARPEIGDYAFTTLTPNLGVVDIDKTSVLFADIPGLIEGAADGKGLGHDFLRHIERTAVILHLVEAYNDDVAATYLTVKGELKAYQAQLAKRPEIVVLTKIDGLDDEIVNDLLAQLKSVAPKSAQVMAISAQSGQGLQPMLYKVKDAVEKARVKAAAVQAEIDDALPVLKIDNTQDNWYVEKDDKDYVVTGTSIERFARRTDFGNEEGVQRLRDIMQRTGIMHELIRKGIEPGDIICIGVETLTY